MCHAGLVPSDAAVEVAIFEKGCAPDSAGTPISAPPTPPAATAVTTATPVTKRLCLMRCLLERFGTPSSYPSLGSAWEPKNPFATPSGRARQSHSKQWHHAEAADTRVLVVD